MGIFLRLLAMMLGVGGPVPAQATPPPPPAQQVPAAAADPYGFGPWLNTYRASRGLRPLAYDPTLAGYCAQNNAYQAARGLGHYGPGGYPMGAPYSRRENAGMGSLAQVEQMWTLSPPHNAALLDPAATFYGIAGSGPWWTYNAR